MSSVGRIFVNGTCSKMPIIPDLNLININPESIFPHLPLRIYSFYFFGDKSFNKTDETVDEAAIKVSRKNINQITKRKPTETRDCSEKPCET